MIQKYTYIKNVRLIDSAAKSLSYSDLLIREADACSPPKLVGMGQVELPPDARITVVDARGAYACPGFTDLRAHTYPDCKGMSPDAKSVAVSARQGGYSGVVLSPCASYPADSEQSIAQTKELIKNDPYGCIGFLSSVTRKDDPSKISELDKLASLGALGFYDGGDADAFTMRSAMQSCAKTGRTLFLKCEERSLCGGIMNEGERAAQMKLSSTPPLCEELALARNLLLARDTGCKIHVHCVSTKAAVQMIREAKKSGINVTCDTCPQYFTLMEDSLLFKGTSAKTDPPLRSRDDVMAVIEGIADSTVDAIATDHTPCDKFLKARSLENAPYGMLMLETALLVGITSLIFERRVSIYRLVDAMCEAPLRILGLDRKGHRGINVFTLTDETYVTGSFFKCGYSNSPFSAWHFSGKLCGYYDCIW